MATISLINIIEQMNLPEPALPPLHLDMLTVITAITRTEPATQTFHPIYTGVSSGGSSGTPRVLCLAAIDYTLHFSFYLHTYLSPNSIYKLSSPYGLPDTVSISVSHLDSSYGLDGPYSPLTCTCRHLCYICLH